MGCDQVPLFWKASAKVYPAVSTKLGKYLVRFYPFLAHCGNADTDNGDSYIRGGIYKSCCSRGLPINDTTNNSSFTTTRQLPPTGSREDWLKNTGGWRLLQLVVVLHDEKTIRPTSKQPTAQTRPNVISIRICDQHTMMRRDESRSSGLTPNLVLFSCSPIGSR